MFYCFKICANIISFCIFVFFLFFFFLQFDSKKNPPIWRGTICAIQKSQPVETGEIGTHSSINNNNIWARADGYCNKHLYRLKVGEPTQSTINKNTRARAYEYLQKSLPAESRRTNSKTNQQKCIRARADEYNRTKIFADNGRSNNLYNNRPNLHWARADDAKFKQILPMKIGVQNTTIKFASG